MSIGEHIIYWWAGLTMEEVFLVTWGGILGFGVLAGVLVALVAIISERRKKKRKLKSCPFCGGEADIGIYDYGEFTLTHYVYCSQCGAESFDFDTEAEAEEAWNRRDSG